MSPYQKKQKEKRRKNLFRKWHRRIGFGAAIILINLAITGVLLNHSEDLELHKKYIESDWLVSYYGIQAPEHADCVQDVALTLKYSICQLDDIIFLGDRFLIEDSTQLVGLVEINRLYYLATSSKIYVFTKDFRLVESLSENSGMPTPITKIARIDYRSNPVTEVQLAVVSDRTSWAMNDSTMEWNIITQLSVVPAQLQPAVESNLSVIKAAYLDKQITLLKFIQDLHSGRVLSTPGKLLTDLAALVILLLIISGFFAWQKRTSKVK
jgi:hypothetical protein